MLASQNEEKIWNENSQFETAFKNVFEKIKEKNKAGQLKVALIDDWTKIYDGIEARLVRNKIMAEQISTKENTLFLCGGDHFEGAFKITRQHWTHHFWTYTL